MGYSRIVKSFVKSLKGHISILFWQQSNLSYVRSCLIFVAWISFSQVERKCFIRSSLDVGMTAGLLLNQLINNIFYRMKIEFLRQGFLRWHSVIASILFSADWRERKIFLVTRLPSAILRSDQWWMFKIRFVFHFTNFVLSVKCKIFSCVGDDSFIFKSVEQLSDGNFHLMIIKFFYQYFYDGVLYSHQFFLLPTWAILLYLIRSFV